ncbi:LOW QUALITY PROTEIN: conserved hypothetical protein, partial [Streptomyces himastatinicus ATCC 53653]
EAARTLADQVPHREPPTDWGYVKDLATRAGGTPATARWDTGSVLKVVTQLAGDRLVDRILAQLPSGYAPSCSAASS